MVNIKTKNGCKFSIDDCSSFFDWCNAYFEMHFQLQKLANGEGYANENTITIINGSHSLIRH